MGKNMLMPGKNIVFATFKDIKYPVKSGFLRIPPYGCMHKNEEPVRILKMNNKVLRNDLSILPERFCTDIVVTEGRVKRDFTVFHKIFKILPLFSNFFWIISITGNNISRTHNKFRLFFQRTVQQYGINAFMFVSITVCHDPERIGLTFYSGSRRTIDPVPGIVLAFVSIFCFSLSSAESSSGKGYLWLVLALIVFACWGTQAFIMKVANNYSPDAESIFVYMAISALLFIPVAIGMTDFSVPVNWGWNGPYLAFMTQILNAIGALFLVYAMRYGKAMVVSPLADALSPVITVLISLVIYQQVPPAIQIVGIVSALSCIFILSRE